MVFAGAGVSKASPASAPLWSELQYGFIEAVYERLRGQGWHASNDLLSDADVLQTFRFRPEVFWDVVQRASSLDVVQRAFKVLQGGSPNLTHRTLAHLVGSGGVTAVITTNFDEYVERVLRPEVYRITGPAAAAAWFAGDRTEYCLLKLHGTLSEQESLRFTLDHIDVLAGPLAACLQRLLRDRRLLVVGYSGWDEDIMPHLTEAVSETRETMVVVHPGSAPEQPIRGLEHAGATIIEADIGGWISALGAEEVASGRASPSLLDDDEASSVVAADVYHAASHSVELVVAAIIVSDLHELAGNPAGALRYAGLAIDICDDERYAAASLPHKDAALARVNRAESVLGTGGVYTRFHQSRLPQDASTSISPGELRQAMAQSVAYADTLVRKETLTAEEERTIERDAVGALHFAEGPFGDKELRPSALSVIGKLRGRQGRWIEAANAYLIALPIETRVLGHVGTASFYVDAGVAAMHASGTPSEDAPYWYGAALSLTEQALNLAEIAHDHLTVAKAAMNLARLRAWNDEPDVAAAHIVTAEVHAALVADRDLRLRLNSLRSELGLQ